MDAGATRQAADEFIALMNRLRRMRAANSLPPGVKVSPALMPLISHLAESPDSSVKEIAAALGLSTPTVSVSLRRLERQGLVSRRPDPKDSRAVQVFLTPRGEEVYEQVRAFRRRLAAEMLGGLEPREREELIRLLGKALAAAENAPAEEEGSASKLADKRRVV